MRFVLSYRKKIIDENLRKSFPDKSSEELVKIRNAFYKNFCDVVVESIKLVSISKEELIKRCRWVNVEVLDNYFSDKQSLIAVGGHYCNWEMGGLALSVVAKHKTLGVYKPLTDKSWDAYFTGFRSRFGMELVPMNSIVRKLASCKNEVTLTTLIADQTPAKEDIVYRTTFLNQHTPVFLGPEKMAKLTGYPVVYFSIQRIKRGYYSVLVEIITQNPKDEPEFAITKKHLQILERDIKSNPANWLWSHRRWKY